MFDCLRFFRVALLLPMVIASVWCASLSMQSIEILSESEDEAPRRDQCHTKQNRQRGQSSRASSSKLQPISELSDSSSDHQQELREVGIRRGKKRSKQQLLDEASLKKRLSSEVHCRAMLAKRCPGCRRSCLLHFTQKTKFKELMEFRKLWNDMHKLDQDRMVCCTLWVRVVGCFSYCP